MLKYNICVKTILHNHLDFKIPAFKNRKNIIFTLLLLKKENEIYKRHLWWYYRISDELNKIGIELHSTTVNKIIQTFSKNGQIQPVGIWKKFIKAHWNSLFSMDYMTIDTLFGKRFY